ncbi:MAG: hypothetical protein K2X93_24850 [Candidatus Obscuribacterales bacterium]|nr:hypothetical protein [Candidatus Obscuribacterales bacterium]
MTLGTDKGVSSMRRVESLYQEVVEVFHRTVKHGVSACMRLSAANRRVDILSVNPEQSGSYLKALQHLVVEEESAERRSADLTILLMDSATTGVQMPDIDLLKTPREEPRKAFQSTDGRILASLEGEQAALNIANLNENVALLWLPSFETVPGYQLATPFRTIFNWLFCDGGYQLIHAAAVGFDEGGVLLSGKSGSGKTVASLACLQYGARFLGDDFVIIGPATTGGGIVAYSIYSSARLHREMMGSFGLSEAALIDDKALFFLYPEFSSQLSSELPIRSVFLPNRKDAGSTCTRIPTVNLIREVLVPTVAYLPGRESVVLKNLTTLLSNTPFSSIDLGGDPKKIPDVLRRAVAGSRS